MKKSGMLGFDIFIGIITCIMLLGGVVNVIQGVSHYAMDRRFPDETRYSSVNSDDEDDADSEGDEDSEEDEGSEIRTQVDEGALPPWLEGKETRGSANENSKSDDSQEDVSPESREEQGEVTPEE